MSVRLMTLAAGLLFATAALADCVTNSYYANGRLVVCTTCCQFGSCTTSCF